MQWLYLLSSCFPSNGADTGRIVVVSCLGVLRMTMNVQVPGPWERLGTHQWVNVACKPTAGCSLSSIVLSL